MSFEVSVRKLPAQQAAVIEISAHPSEMLATIRSGYNRLSAAIAAAGLEPAGPPFFVMEEVFDDEQPARIRLGYPVTTPFPPDGEVHCTELAACEVATTIHRGPFSEAGPAYRAIEEWISANDYVAIGLPWEVYLVSPADTTDALQYVTEIHIPIASR